MVLDALDEQEGLGVTQVGEVIAVDQPRASKLVARAAEEGLVSRSRAKPDGRKQELRLTASGRRIVEEAHRVRQEAVAATLSGFSEEEATTFAELLSRFVDRW